LASDSTNAVIENLNPPDSAAIYFFSLEFIAFVGIVQFLHKHKVIMLYLKEMCYNGKKYKEVVKMTVSYKKLWKLLIDRDMKKKDLQAAARISPSSISKLSKNKYVSMDVLVKVCTALNVDFKDIMELVPNTAEERK